MVVLCFLKLIVLVVVMFRELFVVWLLLMVNSLFLNIILLVIVLNWMFFLFSRVVRFLNELVVSRWVSIGMWIRVILLILICVVRGFCILSGGVLFSIDMWFLIMFFVNLKNEERILIDWVLIWNLWILLIFGVLKLVKNGFVLECFEIVVVWIFLVLLC